jgi:hypothetical protein
MQDQVQDLVNSLAVKPKTGVRWKSNARKYVEIGLLGLTGVLSTIILFTQFQ